MDVINNDVLEENIISHKKAIGGDFNCKRLDMGTFYEKKLNNFMMEGVEDLSSYPIQNSAFQNCIFKNVDFGRTEFYKTIFSSCIFENCSFIKAEILKVNFNICTFKESNFFASSIDGSLNNCIFKNCNFDKSYLTESKIVNTIFTGESKPPNTRDNEEHNVIWNLQSPQCIGK
ncbi:pentapeptide repeat-containing protein [Roseivirga sp. BDSF3-8]|uniref:pentapeptide repeat-containing protein n=1 Tax=Roseivirga sp. BDSF3-8 TaxID=3241598 RepID=UPI003531F882